MDSKSAYSIFTQYHISNSKKEAIKFCGANNYEWQFKGGFPTPYLGKLDEVTNEIHEEGLKKFADRSLDDLEDAPEEFIKARELISATELMFDGDQNGTDDLFIETLTTFQDMMLVELEKTLRQDTSFQLSWIATRYLELCLFQHIQDSINNRKGLETPQLKEEVALILHVLSTTEKVVPPWAELRNMDDLTVMMNDCIDRQDRIRSALWVYCSIMVSKLPAFENFWEGYQKDIPALCVNCLPQSFKESLESFDQRHMMTPKMWSWMAQPFYYERSGAAEELDKIKKFIVAFEHEDADGVFRCLFQDIAHGFLDDLAVGMVDTSSHLNPVKASRMFFALANWHWKFQDMDGLGHLFRQDEFHLDSRKTNEGMNSAGIITDFVEYLRFKVCSREDSVRIYNSVLESVGDTFTGQWILDERVEEVDLQSYHDRESVSTDYLILKVCAIGRRWQQLIEIAGQAIILCGSPLIDYSSHWNIPMIVETGSNEKFESLCSALNTNMQWVKEVCGQMEGVVTMWKNMWEFDESQELQEEEIEKWREIARNLTETIHSAVGVISPMKFLSGELRSMGLGTPAQDVIHQLQKSGLLSTPVQKKLFDDSIRITRVLVSKLGLSSKAQLAALRDINRSACMGNPAPEYRIYMNEIFENLWFKN